MVIGRNGKSGPCALRPVAAEPDSAAANAIILPRKLEESRARAQATRRKRATRIPAQASFTCIFYISMLMIEKLDNIISWVTNHFAAKFQR